MEKLNLETVLNAEKQAQALGPASVAALQETARKWQAEHQLGLLSFGEGVAEVIERITNWPQ